MTQQRNDVIKTPTSILFDKADNFQFFLVQGTKKICTVSGRKDSEQDDESDDNPTKDENKIEENSLEEWLYFRRLKIKLYRDNLN